MALFGRLMAGSRRLLLPAAGMGAAVLYVQSEYRDFLAVQEDGDCETSLPSTTEAQLTRVVRLPKFFSKEEVDQIHALHQDVGSRVGTSGRTASNQAASYHTGVWEVAYLSTDSHFRDKLPGLREKLVQAATQVDDDEHWGLLRGREHVRPRCIEYHVVGPNGSLPYPHHHDIGSLITVDVMLAEDGDFTGGTFQTLEADGTMAKHAFERGDAMVFVSHKPHCVDAVRSGERRVLIMELWEGEERACGHRCDRHWGECGHTASHSFWRRAMSDIGSDLER